MDVIVSKIIYQTRREAQRTPDGGIWKYLDISGEHLGLRLEELAPGETSSTHHFHTLEEEHVIVLEGEAMLVLGSDQHPLKRRDHVWFKAGDERGHHIVNKAEASFRYLVPVEGKKSTSSSIRRRASPW